MDCLTSHVTWLHLLKLNTSSQVWCTVDSVDGIGRSTQGSVVKGNPLLKDVFGFLIFLSRSSKTSFIQELKERVWVGSFSDIKLCPLSTTGLVGFLGRSIIKPVTRNMKINRDTLCKEIIFSKSLNSASCTCVRCNINPIVLFKQILYFLLLSSRVNK